MCFNKNLKSTIFKKATSLFTTTGLHRMKTDKPIELDLKQISALQQRLSSGLLEKGDNEILSGVITVIIFRH
jgi:hypothetical protein